MINVPRTALPSVLDAASDKSTESRSNKRPLALDSRISVRDFQEEKDQCSPRAVRPSLTQSRTKRDDEPWGST